MLKIGDEMRIFNNTQKKEVGQALAEFAICLPLLITIFCGILDFGWIYMNEYEVNHASYEAARYAAGHIKDAGMTKATLENNMKALVENNLTHKSSSLAINIDGLYLEDFPSITVTNPVHMLTYVGSLFFGSVYDVSVTNSFYAAVT